MSVKRTRHATQEALMSVQLYKDGNAMAIETDCDTEALFVRKFCHMLSEMIEAGSYDGDWEGQLHSWLPQFVEICNAYKGYKTSVRQKTVYIAGEASLGNPVYSLGDGEYAVTQHRNSFASHETSVGNGVEPS
jgi:hypothetical protein